ncbi:MAG: radical SAM protein [bacterium]
MVFNLIRDCNLECVHCYAGSRRKRFPGQLNTPTIKKVLEDLAEFDVPAVLFSGGEPLIHPDFFDILEHAENLGLRTTLSTNGTLVDEETALRLKESGLQYVGISIDGIGETNDRFRGMEKAFERALEGIRRCREVSQKVGLRMTITDHNIDQIDEVFDLIVEEDIQRACFYHLSYSGRGKDIRKADLSDHQARNMMVTIFDRTRKINQSGRDLDVLTVANPVDNAFLYKYLYQEDRARAEKVLRHLEWNGGGLNSSGVGVGAIDFYGRVHPNQFWMDRTLGNVKNRPFSEIWTDTDNEFLMKLRDRLQYLEGKCGECSLQSICGGGMRVRADATDHLWGPDPACYLTERERNIPEFLSDVNVGESIGA